GRITAGFTELARFDGTSQTPLYFIPFVPYSYWEKRPKSGGVSPADSTGDLLRKNNVLWAADVAWSFRPGWRVYGEVLMDDYSLSSDYKPDMLGYQAGADWRRTLKGRGAIGAAVEYSRVNNFTYSVWHRHDFSYNGFPTGYVLGPDVQALSGEATLEWGPNLEFRLRGDWRRKGEGRVGDAWLKTDGKVEASAFQGVVERETRVRAAAIFSPVRLLHVEAVVGHASIRNLDHVLAPPEIEAPLRIDGRVEW